MQPSHDPSPNAAYAALDARSFRASDLTRGPWDPEHQHAGPPIALVCRAFEQAAQAHGLTHLARLTANLLRPVPIGGVTYPSAMPPFGASLGDADIADIANHERTSWGNQGKPATADQVKAARAKRPAR